jgi:polysaccharide chain length determinant protein (PEP-CTERM system associated)
MLGHRAMSLDDYLMILKRRWWIIAIPTMVLPIIAIGVTHLIPPRYVSETLVLIDQQKVPDEFVRSVVTENLDARLASMKEQILSRSQVQPIIEKYNLYADQKLPMDGRLDLARKAIDIQPIHSEISGAGGLPGFKIFFTASDPHTAQQVCSEITSLFTGANLIQREQAAEGTTDFLKEELEDSKHTLDDQDAKLAAFQQKYFGMQPQDQASNVNFLTALTSRLDAITQYIEGLQEQQTIEASIIAQQPAAAPGTPFAAVQTPQIQQQKLDELTRQEADLTARGFTADYPEVKSVRRSIADLQKQMSATPAPAAVSESTVVSTPNRVESPAVQKARADLRGIALAIENKKKEQEQIQQEIRMYQGRIQATPEVEEQYKGLTRDVQTSQALYDRLRSELDQSQMASRLEHRQEGETFRVLDASNLPEAPTFPKLSVFAGGGLALGIMLGLVIVAFLEYKDTALRTERDVWAFTQLPTLAVIVWSGDIADSKPGKLVRLKRLFSRKTPKKLLADATG